MEPTRGAHGARDAQDGAAAPAQDGGVARAQDEPVEPARDAHGAAARAQDDRDGGARAAAYDEARALLVFNNDKAGMGAISAADKERISAKVLAMTTGSAFDANQRRKSERAEADIVDTAGWSDLPATTKRLTFGGITILRAKS